MYSTKHLQIYSGPRVIHTNIKFLPIETSDKANIHRRFDAEKKLGLSHSCWETLAINVSNAYKGVINSLVTCRVQSGSS